MEARSAEIALLADATGSASNLVKTDRAVLRKMRHADEDVRIGARARTKIGAPMNGGRGASQPWRKAHAKAPGLRLRLYAAGHAPNSVCAVASVRAICDEHFASGHELEIVDLLEHPMRALADGIIVTPTLLKLLPLPVQRVIGRLSDTNQLLLALSSR